MGQGGSSCERLGKTETSCFRGGGQPDGCSETLTLCTHRYLPETSEAAAPLRFGDVTPAKEVLVDPEVAWLLSGCPRELAKALLEAPQWGMLRCRPWLSPAGLRGLHRGLERCRLAKVVERYVEARVVERCMYTSPVVVPWSEVDQDFMVSPGQVLRLQDAPAERVDRLRDLGLYVLRQGKVGVVLLAGGANFRLSRGEPPVGCASAWTEFQSGKSIVQLLCERLRRLLVLSARSDRTGSQQPVVPVFVMTSRLTHRRVVEHFRSNHFFGLSERDVSFFEQPVVPVLDHAGRLLPQSLGGEFAHAPGGTGGAIQGLVLSSALEKMRDRGVDYVHILGTENPLAKICDPLFIGLFRDLDLECSCKVTERFDAKESLELFCVRESSVSSQYADSEESACGLDPREAPSRLLHERTEDGRLACPASMNSFLMTVAYLEQVAQRRPRERCSPRVVPYLDFYIAAAAPDWGDGNQEEQAGLKPSGWPPETAASDLACQRGLMEATGQVRLLPSSDLLQDPEVLRCDVQLQCQGPAAVVRVKTGAIGPALLPLSVSRPEVSAELLRSRAESGQRLRCSLVVPAAPNASVLESTLLDYFAFSDRALAVQVPREGEFAPICERQGNHTAAAARSALHELHRGWLSALGAEVEGGVDVAACVEVSPLLSYAGEGLEELVEEHRGCPLKSPLHWVDLDEERGVLADSGPLPADHGFDLRPFYLQEYPQRLKVSRSREAATGSGGRSPGSAGLRDPAL